MKPITQKEAKRLKMESLTEPYKLEDVGMMMVVYRDLKRSGVRCAVVRVSHDRYEVWRCGMACQLTGKAASQAWGIAAAMKRND